MITKLDLRVSDEDGNLQTCHDRMLAVSTDSNSVGSLTPRAPYSPRKYYERRLKDSWSRSSVDLSKNSEDLAPVRRPSAKSRDSDVTTSNTLSSFTNGLQHTLQSVETETESCQTNQRFLTNGAFLKQDQSLCTTAVRSTRHIICQPSTVSDCHDASRPGGKQSTVSGGDTNDSGISETTSSAALIAHTDPVLNRSCAPRAAPSVAFPLPQDGVTVSVGDRIRLSCVISGCPKPKVVWMKDAVGLLKNPEYTFEQHETSATGGEGVEHHITLHSARVEHGGTYTVSAFNLYGDAASHTAVVVSERGENILRDSYLHDLNLGIGLQA